MGLGLTGVPLVDFLVLTVTILFAVLYFTNKKDPRYPPGPKALPVLGNLLQLGTRPHKALLRWADQYGPVFSVKMGSDDTIMVCDHKIIKEVFADAHAVGRPPNPIMKEFGGGGNYGVIMSEGAHWDAQRRFIFRKLREFGFAKSSMEGLIMEEANSMLNWFDKRLDTPIPGNRIFNGAVANSLWSIISGEREEWDAPKTPTIIRHSQGVIDAINRMTSTGLFFTPILRHLAPKFFGWTAWVTHLTELSSLASKTIKRHDDNLDSNSPGDLIDHYLIEQKQTTDPSSSFYKETGERNLNILIADLFIAGSETTSHTLSWAMMYLSRYPKYQMKLQRELDTVVGRSRNVSITDKPNLPYTEALIMELLRKSAISTVGIPHKMTKDVVYQGFLFPKDTTVISYIYRVLRDPNVWGDPENFRPERFLSPDGTKVVKHDALIPFSIGKRQCIGKTLAEDTVFLFLTAMFQKYTMKPDPDSTGDEMREENVMSSEKLMNAPPPFKVVVALRE